MFAKVWPASLQIRPCFLTLAKIGDTEIFAKMAYGTVKNPPSFSVGHISRFTIFVFLRLAMFFLPAEKGNKVTNN